MRLASLTGLSLAVPILFFGLAGCSGHIAGTGTPATGSTSTPPPPSTPSNHLTGVVHGGQQPVSGSSIQLYAVGAASPTALLASPVTSDSSGGFDITGLYTCPAGDPLVYMAGLGGNPGAGTNNNLAMMVLLGSCSTLKTMSFVTINEVTSVGAIVAASKYITSATTITYGSDSSGIASAFNTATAVVNPATGTVGGPSMPEGEGVSTAEVNTLANIMAACINTKGGTAGDGSACGTLFAATGGTDTIAALLAAIQNPTTNTSVLCNLASTNSPFQPQLTDCGTGSTSNAPSGSLPDPTPLPLTATPVFVASEGANSDRVYNLGTSVTISDATPGAAIYYTTDGTLATRYSMPYAGGPIAIPDLSTGLPLCAIAVAAGHVDASTCMGFTAATDAPTFLEAGSSPGPYPFNSSVVATVIPYGSPALNPTNPLQLSGLVTASSATANAVLYYVVDNTGTSVPTTNSAQVTGPLPLAAGQFLNVMALAPNRAPSIVSHMAFQVQSPPSTFSPASGSYPAGTVITMNDAQPGMAIHYTTDGSEPTSASPLYSSAITLDQSARFIAIAIPPAGYLAPNFTTEADYAIQPYTGVLSLVGGNYNGGILNYGYSGDGGIATGVSLAAPSAVAVDSGGTIYIADTGNNCVRAVDTSGVMTKFAGVCGSSANYGGDGATATEARFNSPSGVAVDGSGNVYIVDRGNSCVRVVSGGVIHSFAGVCETAGLNNLSGPAGSTYLNTPEGVAVDSAGNVYIADTYNNVVRKVDHTTLNMTIIAGLPTESGGGGDGGAAALALLGHPVGLAIDANNNVYISDATNNNVRKIDNSSDDISTVAGAGADLTEPEGVAVDSAGNVYVADTGHSRVIKVATSGTISLYAGDGSGSYGGYGGPAVAAWLGGPAGLALNSSGDLYITTFPYPGSSVVVVHH